MGRAPCCSKVGLHKGPWSTKEDRLLTDYIQANGEGQWRSLPEKAGLLRCGKSCRLRWMNYLRPGIKRGNITTEEEDLIIRHQSLLGNRWSLIAARLPGRTDNEIKNFWNTHLLKRLKKEGIEPKSNKNVMKEGSKEPKKKTKDDASRKTKPSKLKSIINMDYSDHNQAKKPNIDRDDFDHKEELSMMTKVCVPKPIEVYSKLATSNSFGSVVSGNSSPSNQEEVDKKAKTEACDEDDILRSSFELGDRSYNKRVDICDEDQILFDDCYLLNQGAAPVSEILLEMVYDEYLQLL